MPQTRHKQNPAKDKREKYPDPEDFLAWCKDEGPGDVALSKKHGGTRAQWAWQKERARTEVGDTSSARKSNGEPGNPGDMRTKLGNREFVNFVSRNGGPSACARLFGGTQSGWSTAKRNAEAEILMGNVDPAHHLRALEQENSDLRAANTALEDQWTNLELIVRRACGRFPYVKPSYPTPKRKRSNLEEVVLLDLSDFQAGQKVTSGETGGVETFDTDTLRQRMERWKEKVYIIVQEVIRKTVPVHRCVVVLGGDLIEGENVYRGQAFHIDSLALEQLTFLINEVGALLAYLAGMFEEVWVKTVDGNHGLVWATSMNLDRFAYIMMRETLKDQTNVHWAISEAHMNAWTMGPHLFHTPQDYDSRAYLAIHGDEIRSHYGTPFYGLTRAYFEYTPVVGQLIDAMFCHHHHRAGVGPDEIWFLNGSWPGATDYSLKRMRGASRPQQWLLTYHQEVGLTSHRPLFLADRTPLPETAEGQLTTTLPEVFFETDPKEAYQTVRDRLAEEGQTEKEASTRGSRK